MNSETINCWLTGTWLKIMVKNIFKFTLTMMSLVVLTGSNLFCISASGDLNFTFIHDAHAVVDTHQHALQSGACQHSHSQVADNSIKKTSAEGGCYDQHSSCNDILTDFEAMSVSTTQVFKTLNVTSSVAAFIAYTPDTHSYVTRLYKTVVPPLTLQQLSTVILTT